jgi:Family of unknown function (DUF6318)
MGKGNRSSERGTRGVNPAQHRHDDRRCLVLCAGLAACDDGSDDPPDSGLPSKSELTESTPASTATEPWPTPPELPENATRNTSDAAAAFVRHYIALLDYAAHTGDVGPMNQLSTPTCTGCRDDASLYRRLYAKGGWARGGRRQVANIKGILPVRPEDLEVSVAVKRAKGTYRSREGAGIKTFPANVDVLHFYLVRTEDRWAVARVENQ